MSTSRPPVSPASTLWSSLVKYYRSCLEREQDLAVRVPADPLAFVLLRNLDEHLITQKAITTILTDPVHTQPVLGYLNHRGKGIGGTFIYGYPLARHEGALIPLCYTEVRLEPGTAPNTVVLQRGNAELLVNHHFLRAYAGLTDSETNDLLRALRSPKSKGPVNVLDQFLFEVDLVADAVLFGSEATPGSRGPQRELQLMEQLRKERLPETLRIFMGEHGVGNYQQSPGLTILPSDPAQEQVLTRRRAPFLVATGAAGTGKTQTAVNLIASALADGHRVLYVNPDPAATERLFDALTHDGSFPGVWRVGTRELRAASMAHAKTVIESIREPEEQAHDPAALSRDSQRLGQDVARLDAELQQIRWLEEHLPALTLADQQAEESLRSHPLLPAIRKLAGQITPETASLFTPSQLEGIREWRERLTGQDPEENGSLGGRLRGRMRTGQVRTGLKQLGLPDFCIPEGEGDALAEGLSLLEQAFAPLLARGQLMHARQLKAGARSEGPVEQALREAQQAKTLVDRKRLHNAWLQVAAQVRPDCDQMATIVEQEERALHGTGKARVQGRGQLAELLKAFPVTLSQTLLVAGLVPNEPELFDLLIVDNASSADLPSFLPVLYRAKRVCILGDELGPKHFTHLGDEEDARLLGLIEGFNLAPFAYVDLSVLDRAKAVVGPDQVIELTRQYSSAPPMVQLLAEQFYPSLLPMRRDRPGPADKNLPATGFRFADVPDGQTVILAPDAISQAQNPAEAKQVARLVTQAITQGMTDLAVLTPFRGQALLIGSLLKRLSELERDPVRAERLRQVEVTTCQTAPLNPHRVLLLSMVAAQGATPAMLNWLEQNRALLNRSLQHGTDLVIVVGRRATLSAGSGILAALVRHADRMVAARA